MISRFIKALPGLTLGFLILGVSIYKSAELKYSFNETSKSIITTPAQLVHVNYDLPEATTSPSLIFWPVEAFGDRVETVMAADNYQKSLILLDHSDKRLSMGLKIFSGGDVNNGVATINKAEGYLMESLDSVNDLGLSEDDKNIILKKLSLASLKHREVLEDMLVQAPDDARPVIAKTLDIPKSVYTLSSAQLSKSGQSVIPNPFDEQN